MIKLDRIGKNIRKFCFAKKLRQEDLAEKTGLTTNYIGMVERGEKIPLLETFIKILNALWEYHRIWFLQMFWKLDIQSRTQCLMRNSENLLLKIETEFMKS